MWYRIVSNLNYTLIVIMNNSQGFDKKPKLSQEYLNLDGLSTSINYITMLCFHSRERDYLLFLGLKNQWYKTKVRHKSKSGFLIITISFPVKVGLANQRIWTSTMFDTKPRCTLQIINNTLCIFLVDFYMIMDEVVNHTNNNENVQSTISEVDKAMD